MNRFFLYVWRFNVLVQALAGILAIVLCLLVLREWFPLYFGDIETSNLVNVEDSSNNIHEKWLYGSLQNVPGTHTIILPVHSEQDYEIDYYRSKESISNRNLLFVNNLSETELKVNWLFPDNQKLILEYNFLNLANELYDENQTTLAMLYHVVSSDSDNDGRLSEDDHISLYLSHTDGREVHKVADNVDQVLGIWVLSVDKVILFIASQNQTHLLRVRIPEGEIEQTFSVPTIPSLS